MIALDTNLLVYAHREESPEFGAASALLRSLAENRSPWAIPWPCLYEFVAVVTHARIFDPPTPLDLACRQVAAWLASPSLVVLGEGRESWEAFARMAVEGGMSGAAVHDARIAGLCESAGVEELWTADRGFARFGRIKTRNPLAGPPAV